MNEKTKEALRLWDKYCKGKMYNKSNFLLAVKESYAKGYDKGMREYAAYHTP